MALWYTETFEDKVRFALKVKRTLHASRSQFQTIELFETEALGKTLALDGIFQTSEGDEYYYHEMITHPALCSAPSIKRVLVIGGGDGGTAREVLRHAGVERCVMVEIDGDVVAACKEHIPHFGAWDDPRLELIIGDGIAYAREAAEASFDAVLLDGSDPVGPSEGLFNREFYASVRRCLAPDGVFALQSESPLLMPELFEQIQATLSEEFSTVRPYFGPVLIYGASQWSWTFASDGVDPLAINEGRVQAIEDGCRYYNREIHRGAFALPNDLVKKLRR
jgi:spermidine synthase